ncbi:hypothetical protein ABIC84_003996 [Mucilaginibacter sp. 3215]
MVPIRLITDDVSRRITYFYSKPFYTSFGLMFNPCFGAPLIVFFGSIGGWIIFVPLLLAWAGIFYLILSVKSKKIKKAKEVYEFGYETTIYFQGIDYNYSVQVNGAPQPMILLRINSETIKVKTFNQRVIRAFDVPVQRTYMMDKYPDIILPENLFSMNMANPSTKLRSIDM